MGVESADVKIPYSKTALGAGKASVKVMVTVTWPFETQPGVADMPWGAGTAATTDVGAVMVAALAALTPTKVPANARTVAAAAAE